jgi:hypothetical protein
MTDLTTEDFNDATPEEIAAAIAEIEEVRVNDPGTEAISDEEVPVEEEET